MKKYFKIWITTSLLSVQTSLENRTAVILFAAGKFIRFFLFLYFLYVIHDRVIAISGFSLDQMVTFFLVFNLFDLFGQLFFRGIYWFREQVVSGEFDFRLLKPASSLFQVLTRNTDILDLPLLFVVIIMLFRQNLSLSISDWVSFVAMVIAACLIITAIHIFVAALGVVSTEVDHTIMIYRDLSTMARFPVDIYTDLIRSFLTFVVPIAIAYTYPAKAIMGLLSFGNIILSLSMAILILGASLFAWNQALKQYSSASS